jgi:hypothetical protein
MASLWDDLNARVKTLAVSWPSYAALGSFALYLLGYLALRFHLTALGVGTDLSVVDERYLFAGAKFVVFLVSTIPILVLLFSPLALLMYVVYRLAGRRPNPSAVTSRPDVLCVCGIVIAVILIQFVMRQCLFYSNLLMACDLPGPQWLRFLILQRDDGLRSLYFSGLVAGFALTGMLLFLAVRNKSESAAPSSLKGLLAGLIAIEFLFLPINYGTLIMDKTLPKVSDVGAEAPLTGTQSVWLVWEGAEGITYFVRKTGAAKDQISLVTLPRKDVKRTEITGYDPILRELFEEGAICAP